MITIESPPGTVPFIEVNLNTIRSMVVEDRAEVAKLCYDLGLHNRAQEEVWVVSIDGARNIRAVVPVAKGGYHEVYVSTPAILSAVLLTASDRFVLVHNHPSGDLIPTALDKSLTKDLQLACKQVDIMFDDHIIVGPPNGWRSLRADGLML